MEADDFRCPICLNLLYKPAVVPTCGHTFCFHCLFRSMSPYEATSCPLCRKHFSNLPGVRVGEGPGAMPVAQAWWWRARFGILRAQSLNHPPMQVCLALHDALRLSFPEQYAQRGSEEEEEVRLQGYELPSADEDAAPGSEGAPVGACPAFLRCADPTCALALALPSVLICGHALCCAHVAQPPAEGAGTQGWTCPKCEETTLLPVSSCAALDAAVRKLAPAAHAQALERRGTRPVVPVGADKLGPARPAPRPDAPPAADDLLEARATNFVANFAPDSYIHYAVGCDGCGVHPIAGRRWRCADCKAAIGFDLCQSCKERLSSHQIRGRHVVVWVEVFFGV